MGRQISFKSEKSNFASVGWVSFFFFHSTIPLLPLSFPFLPALVFLFTPKLLSPSRSWVGGMDTLPVLCSLRPFPTTFPSQSICQSLPKSYSKRLVPSQYADWFPILFAFYCDVSSTPTSPSSPSQQIIQCSNSEQSPNQVVIRCGLPCIQLMMLSLPL